VKSSDETPAAVFILERVLQPGDILVSLGECLVIANSILNDESQALPGAYSLPKTHIAMWRH